MNRPSIQGDTIYLPNIDSPTLERKQDLLVSGENIKTIGGMSILGKGNIPLPSPSPSGDGFYTNALPHDSKVLQIGYSVITSPSLQPRPGNSEAHFLKMISKGYNGIKADMTMTSDGEIVLCHDSFFKLNADGRIVGGSSTSFTRQVEINTLTLAEVLSLEFALSVDGDYVHPCTLDRFLFLCKVYGVVPYITLRDSSDWQEVAGKMYALLCKYYLENVAIVNIFNPSATEAMYIRDAIDHNLLMCYTLYSSQSVSKNAIDVTFNCGCRYMGFNMNNFASLTDDLVAYAHSKGVRLIGYNGSTELNNKAIAMGIVGFQNSTNDDIPLRP